MVALKCYKCSGTEDDCKKSTLEGNKDKYLITCPDEEDKCLRLFLKKDRSTAVVNACTNQAGCVLLEAFCDNVDDLTCKVGCCGKDACNVGSHVSFNVILLTVSSALGLALLM